MARRTIDFYFDFISPYAYLANLRIHDVAAAHDADVRLCPVLFAAALNHHGHKGPAEIPQKRVFVFKDALRRAHAIGAPLAPPPSHPFNPLLMLRACTLPMAEDERRALVDRLFQETWGGGVGVTSAAELDAVGHALGLEDLAARASEDKNKARLRAATDAALARGLFGVPTMFIGKELFWGFDTLPHLEAYLRGEDPIDADALERWRHIAPSATRVPRHVGAAQ